MVRGDAADARIDSFCLEVANRTGSGEPFLALFDMQLSCGDINKSWDLLRRYGSYMDLSAVVRRLPVDTAMADLSDYWDKTLQESVADLRIRKLVGKLSEAEQLQAKQEHISLVRKRLVITGDRICPKCTKRLGSAGLLLTTSGGIFHYTCIS